MRMRIPSHNYAIKLQLSIQQRIGLYLSVKHPFFGLSSHTLEQILRGSECKNYTASAIL